MPIYLEKDVLHVQAGYQTESGRVYVSALGDSAGAYDTALSLAQLASHAHLSAVPESLYDFYGDGDYVRAFALLGWIRGRELSGLDEPGTKSTICADLTTRIYRVGKGKVTDSNGVILETYSTKAPSKSLTAVSKPALVFMDPSDVIMRKSSLKDLHPDCRAALRNMSEHRWVGRPVRAVQDVMQQRRTTAMFANHLLDACWVKARPIIDMDDFTI